jgi:hypothetical protein
MSFVMTGKLDFASLANSIIADMVRIQIQESIMKPFTQGFQGGGGFLGGLQSLFGGVGGMGSTVGAYNGTMNNPSAYVAMTPLATGTDYIPYDNFPALLHKGEKVVPASQNNGGTTNITYAPQISIDARTDRSEVYATVSQAMTKNNQEFADMLRKQGVMA